MTVAEISAAARNNLNALTDLLWSDTEVYQNIRMACNQMAVRTRCIEKTSTSASVASTQSYAKPSDVAEIWRIEYEGRKLQKISKREADTLVPDNTTVLTGTPTHYVEYGDNVYLYPTPTSSSDDIVFWYYGEHATVTASSTLEIPTKYHYVVVSGVTYLMCPKDLGHPLTVFWRDKWFTGLAEVEAHVRRSKKADRFRIVATEEDSLATDFGII